MKTLKKATTTHSGREGVKLPFLQRSEDKKKQTVLCGPDGQSYRWVVSKER